MGKSETFDLEKLFAFYGAYHSNPMNVIIHILLVWPIFFTFLLLLYFTPALFDFSETLNYLPYGINHALVLNVGFVFTMIHAVFYVGLDKRAGTLGAFICILCWVGASVLANSLGFRQSMKVALICQTICWIGQAVGHGIFEKRAPAFTANPARSALTAPFFGLLEVLERLFGYEPYPGFYKAVQAKVDVEIKEWEASKLKKTT